MGIRSRLFALVAVLCLACGVSVLAQARSELHLPWEQWQFHIGDDPSCAQVTIPSCAAQTLKHNDKALLNYWARIDVALPADLRSAPQLGLLVQGELPVYEVFVNGRQIGASGNLATRRGPQYSRAAFVFPATLVRNGHVLIAVHGLGLWTLIPFRGFVPILTSSDQVDGARDVETMSYLRASWQHYLCYAAMFGAGVVFFLLFSVNTRLREYFWLGSRLCSLFAFRFFELAWFVDLHIPAWFAMAMDRILNGISALLLVEFVFAFLRRRVPRFFRCVEVAGFLYTATLVLFLPWSSGMYFAIARLTEGVVFGRLRSLPLLIADLSLLLLVPTCMRSKQMEMRWIGGAVLFITFIDTNRVLGQFGLPSFAQDFMVGKLDLDLRPLAYLLFSVVMLVAMTFRLRRIQDRNRIIEQEIAAARSVQQILIPDEPPLVPGFRVENAYQPAQEVGGDFFQVLPKPNRPDAGELGTFVVLGDVSGKGLKAAMTVAMIVGTVRTLAQSCNSPADLLTQLNKQLCGRGEGFATCLALMIEPSGHITLANAAHLNPYLNGVEIQTAPNLPLGIDASVCYGEIVLDLAPEQNLTLVTDGVVESVDSKTHELFGFERTEKISRQEAASILRAAVEFGSGAPQADDITVLTIARESTWQVVAV